MNHLFKNLKSVTDINDYIIAIADFAAICTDAIYVIDLKKRCFIYMSDNEMFICGHSKDEVIQSGFEKIVHPDDIPLLSDILTVIEKYCSENKDANFYFSFNIRIKADKTPQYMLVYHKLKPIFTDEQILGVCVLKCFVNKTEEFDNVPGDLKLYYYNDTHYRKVSLKNSNSETWEICEITQLTNKEKIILRLTLRGMSKKSIANELKMTYDGLRQTIKRLCEKLGVKTISQALLLAINLGLLSHSKPKEQNPKSKKNEKK